MNDNSLCGCANLADEEVLQQDVFAGFPLPTVLCVLFSE